VRPSIRPAARSAGMKTPAARPLERPRAGATPRPFPLKSSAGSHRQPWGPRACAAGARRNGSIRSRSVPRRHDDSRSRGSPGTRVETGGSPALTGNRGGRGRLSRLLPPPNREGGSPACTASLKPDDLRRRSGPRLRVKPRRGRSRRFSRIAGVRFLGVERVLRIAALPNCVGSAELRGVERHSRLCRSPVFLNLHVQVGLGLGRLGFPADRACSLSPGTVAPIKKLGSKKSRLSYTAGVSLDSDAARTP